ncbi:MAG: PKD domain-containing protein [Bacteroidia bacterium]|nr:PKD domain-containing protein [Bacteroidia bacterium]
MYRFLALILVSFISPFASAHDSCFYQLRANFVAINSCPDQEIGLSNISISAHKNVQWKWDFGDGRHSDQFNPIVTYNKGNTSYRITLKAYDSTTGCRDSIARNIEIFQRPHSEFHSFIKVIDGCRHRQFAAYKTNPIDHSCLWFMPNGDSIYVTGSNYLLVKDTMSIRQNVVRLKVKSDLGCIAESTQLFELVDIEQVNTKNTYIDNSSPNSLKIISDKFTKIILFDELGNQVCESVIDDGACRIDALSKGIYYVMYFQDERVQYTIKTIVY